MITVTKILADQQLRLLNLGVNSSQNLPYNVAERIQAGLNAAGVPSGSTIQVPVIYLGRISNDQLDPVEKEVFEDGRSCFAFTPNMANFQKGKNHYYFPKAYLRNSGGEVLLFENAITQAIPKAIFVENFNPYHRNLGNIHCGTEVIRKLPEQPWWEQLNP